MRRRDHELMIASVAHAIGEDLCAQVAFVGGCTTSLLVTDRFAQEQVRHTDDVDLIVPVLGRAGWYALQSQLRKCGFQDMPPSEDAPICAMRLNGMRVDFMPDDPEVLGFSNPWYADALLHATDYCLPGGERIRLVSPQHFVATKLVAYESRGRNDPLMSQDIEDLLTLIDGRAELAGEVLRSPSALRHDIAARFAHVVLHRDWNYAVQSACNNELARADLVQKNVALLISFLGTE